MKNIIDEITELENTSRQLEPSIEERKKNRDKIVGYTENFIENIYDIKAFNLTDNTGEGLLKTPISEEPIDIDKAIELFKDNVDFPNLNPASGGHLGYIPGGGIYNSALGDYLADVTNNYSGIFYAGPGAVRMENMLIRWMAKIVGFPPETVGNLASGGSIANLIAIVTARDAFNLKALEINKSVIYLSQEVHHCIDKAIRIAGLKECKLNFVELDENYRINPETLKEEIKKDKKEGKKPWLIIASAGTTDFGAIDPLDDIADIAKENNLWFHVDGAYGAFFVLSETGKPRLKGIEKADSLVMDPHKGLFLPYGLGVVLVKDKNKMNAAHYYKANYLQDAVALEEEPSPADLSPELTKHFRGLRLWLPLMLHGVKPFRAGLEEKLLLTKYFYEELKKIDGFEMGPEPELSVASFRYMPKDGDPNKFNQLLLQEILKDGRVFLSSTSINGKFIIRIAVLAFRTHLQTIDFTLRLLKEKVQVILKDWE